MDQPIKLSMIDLFLSQHIICFTSRNSYSVRHGQNGGRKIDTFLDIFHQLGVTMKFTQPRKQGQKGQEEKETTKHTHSKEKKEKKIFIIFFSTFPYSSSNNKPQLHLPLVFIRCLNISQMG